MKITNTGKRDGEEIVQLYLRDLAASISRPVKELKGYKKVMVPAGQSTEITFDITSQDLAFWNKDLIFTTEPGEFDVMIGASSADIRLKATIELVN